MTKRLSQLAAAILVATAASAAPALAQSLTNRVASAADRSVQFSFPARPGVCGDGRTYISTGSGNFYGSFSTNTADQCQAGPVRVVIDLADRNVVALRTYVGAPLAAGILPPGATEIGVILTTNEARTGLAVSTRLSDGRVIFALNGNFGLSADPSKDSIKAVTWTNADGSQGRIAVTQGQP